MRKAMLVAIAIVSVVSLATFGFALAAQGKSSKVAKTSTEVIRGKIISIDSAKNEIVIKNNKTGAESIIVVNSKEISSLKVGEEVKVTLKAGSNTAQTIKKIVHKTESTKK